MSTADDDSLQQRLLNAFKAFKAVGTTGGGGRLMETLGRLTPPTSGSLMEQGLDPTRRMLPSIQRTLPTERDLGLAPMPPTPRTFPSIAELQAGARAMQAGGATIGRGGTFGEAERAVARDVPQVLARAPEPMTSERTIAEPAGGPARGGTPAGADQAVAKVTGSGESDPSSPATVAQTKEELTLKPDWMKGTNIDEQGRPYVEALIGGNPMRRQYTGGRFESATGDPFLDQLEAHMAKLDKTELPPAQIRTDAHGNPYLDFSDAIAAKSHLQSMYQAALQTKGAYLTKSRDTASMDRLAALQERQREFDIKQGPQAEERRRIEEYAKLNPSAVNPKVNPAFAKKYGALPLTPDQEVLAAMGVTKVPDTMPGLLEAAKAKDVTREILERSPTYGPQIKAARQRAERGINPEGESILGRLARQFSPSKMGDAKQNMMEALANLPPETREIYARLFGVGQ